MARNLAHKRETEQDTVFDSSILSEDQKELLNRRQFVLLGSAASATALGIGLASSEAKASEVYATDFSEYVQ